MADVSHPAPTCDEIMALYRERKSDGEEVRQREVIADMRTLSRLRHHVDIPSQYKAITRAVRTPYLRDAWLRTTAALVAKPPIIHFEPIDETQPAKEAAGIAAHWDMAAMKQLNKQNNLDAITESAKSLVRDGESVLKVVHRPDAWANFPKRDEAQVADDYNTKATRFVRASQLPFAWRIVDRLSMLFGNGEYGDDWAIEYGEYPKPFLSRKFGMTNVDGALRNPQNTLGGMPYPEGMASSAGFSVKVEYFDADWWCVIVDGQDAPNFPKANPYSPYLPYFRAMAADSESMLYSLLYLVPRLDEVMTMKMNWAYLGAYPNPIVESTPSASGAITDLPGGDDGQPAKLEWKPGKAMELPEGKTMKFLVPPPVGADINQMAIILTNLVEIAGVPAVLRGQPSSADQPGYAINQLFAAANMSFKIALDSMQRQFEQGFEFIHWLIPHKIGQAVWVRGSAEDESAWLALKPSGSVTQREAPVDMLGPITLTFRPQLPTDEQARAMIANQLVNAPKPLLSRRHALVKYLQEEDPEQILDQIWVEEAMEREPLHTMMVDQALAEAGIVQPQQPGIPGAQMPGTPSAPGGPPDMGGAIPQTPGNLGAGTPSVGGLNRPIVPRRNRAGKPAGAFPGQPNTPITQ